MKLQHVLEARYSGDKRAPWLRDALTVAKTRKERVSKEEDWDFWNDYQDWLNDNKKMLSQIYNALKADRDHSIARFEDPDHNHYRDDDRREFSAELWASNMSHEEFPIFKEFIRMQSNKEQIDFSMMVGNTMFDLLGGLRDEH